MDRQLVQRRTIRVLMTANAFGFMGFISIAAIIPLLASAIIGEDRLAGIPSAAAALGAAAAAAPLALRSKRKGRRMGISLGYLVGGTAAIAAALAGQAGAFWALVVALFFLGAGNASNLQNRFAAADLADNETRARSISWVVWVGTIGAVLGPAGALWVNRVGMDAGFAEWVSPMILGVIGFAVAGFVIWSFLRPDPLELAGGVDADAPALNPFRGMTHSWKLIWAIPRARLALGAMALSQVAMVAVMTMTPLHMRDYGHAELSTLVIAAHVLGMFGLAPLLGRWTDRWGRMMALKAGGTILGAGTVTIVAAGYVPGLMFAGLFLLGVGWNFAFIAGSALITECLPVDERAVAQGLSDVVVRLLAAGAALSSGFVKSAVGFHWLANFATVAAVLIFLGTLIVERNALEPAEATTTS